MKTLSLIILPLLCSGCLFFRYNYKAALNNVPQCAKILDINNDYIEYSIVEVVECEHIQFIYPIPQTFTNSIVHTNIYKAYYVSDTGKFYKLRKVIK